MLQRLGSSLVKHKTSILYDVLNDMEEKLTGSPVNVMSFGFVLGDESKATSNAKAIRDAAEVAWAMGGHVFIPRGLKYVDDVVLDKPITITSERVRHSSSLVNRIQNCDLVHTGTGYLFDFPPKRRPDAPSDTQPVTDGICIMNMGIRGTPSGKGAVRVNIKGTQAGYGRRNTTLDNLQIAGYYGGCGYVLYDTYSNVINNVVVWECAMPFYVDIAHAIDHFGCVYENCSWGAMVLSTVSCNMFGGTLEGFRYLSKMTKPDLYDDSGSFSTMRTKFSGSGDSNSAGVALRVRGGCMNLYGTYIEANKVDAHIEGTGVLMFHGCYFNSSALPTEYSITASAGRLYVHNCRFDGEPSNGRFEMNSTSLRCYNAVITENHYFGSATKPVTVPNIANGGEFDVFIISSDPNQATRVFHKQGVQATGGSKFNILDVTGLALFEDSVRMTGLKQDIPVNSGDLYVDEQGFVKCKK